MTYFLYRREDGKPEVSEYALPLDIFPGWALLGEYEERPNLNAKMLDEEGRLVPDMAELKRQLSRLIERERDRRLNSPVIEYDGKRLNAGYLDKQNLQDKITATNSRMSRGTPTPAQMLVWRDYDNVIHNFASLPVYKSWLEGFAIALEERAMQAWAWSWQKKDALAALATAEEVSAFDPTA